MPSLSLVVTELPTRPESFPPVSAMQSGPHSDKADTVPLPNRFLPVVQTPLPGGTANAQLTSWTAGGATRSVLARRIAERPKHRGKVKSSFNLFDRLRWWLLHPGRIEFLLWLGGTLLLMVVTCMLLLATALSFAWITPPFVSGDIATNSNVDVQNAQTVVTTPGLLLILTDTGPLVPGQVLHLRGQGFTAGGRVRFTHDTMQPILEQDGQPLTVQADTRGTFIASIPVGYPPAWATGKHILVVHDLTTNHLAALTFLLASGPMGQKATATPGPEVTPTTNDPGGFPTPNPVGQTPVPVSPTPTLSPTAGTTPTPQPSPTAATSPTPTPGTTPTANPSPTGSTSPTAVASHTANWSNANLGNDLGNTPYSTDQGSLFSPMMVSLLLTLLLLALLLLGLAGILRRYYR
ncbi:MAG: hypothetical protein AUI36_38015 [Cyanobacteria bacterium 13_1_40CM_2_61_4]|nr:MAG: hypothetical protein AUI36_38015 [Cyanobacteria bacterium 13_1_40CM_2_61_4]